MPLKNNNVYEERESIGSRPSKGRKQEEWVEESFGVSPDGVRMNSTRKPSKSTKKGK